MRNKIRTALWLLPALLLAACSTTKNLPEGEVLYTGQKKMIVKNATSTPTGVTAREEVEAALATAPNNSFMGSSTMRTPFPVGLWLYNAFVNSEGGLGKWIFNHFAATPVLLSSVNPEIRSLAATNVMHDYGFFNGTVTYETFIDKHDSLKAKLRYTVDMKNPYFVDTLYYVGFSDRTQRIIDRSRRRSLVHAGDQFNVVTLNSERTRISNMLRNMGCYYFRPDYMTYEADTTLVRGGHVSLRMKPVAGMPAEAEKKFYVGRKSVVFIDRSGQPSSDSLRYRDIDIFYHSKLPVRPKMLYRWLDYHGYRMKRRMEDSTGIARRQDMRRTYSLHRQTRIQEQLTDLGIFNYLEMKYTPRDTALLSDTLDVALLAMMDKPYDLEFDFDMKIKSNNQMGPGASIILSKKNMFGGGEKWNVELDGSYEWQTGKSRSAAMNSYEVGLSSSLIFPRVLFPKLGKREYDFPATTTFKVYARQLRRAKYYRLLAFGGNVTYDFQPTAVSKHSITPFSLTFNMLSHETEEFIQLREQNPALYISLRNQFVPKMEYTYTYDNSNLKRVRHPLWWQTTIASAGNLTSLCYQLAGKSFSTEGKKFLGVPFAQFLKLNTELRYHYVFNDDHLIAMRLATGVVWSYGNASSAPYTEQFYIGGANSVRSYSARYVGPGGYPPDEDNLYYFINHIGDFRLEANAEWRFHLVGRLNGALFLDAGNVWLLRQDDNRPNGKLTLKNFFDQIALGTGAGLRYDMGMLVLRLDCGVGIHHPYKTSKSGYYNIEKFKDGLALHFAIGYPF